MVDADFSPHYAHDLLRSNSSIVLVRCQGGACRANSTFSSIEVSADGHKRRRIGRAANEYATSPGSPECSAISLQDILRFTHRSFRCNNVTLALLHLGLRLH